MIKLGIDAENGDIITQHGEEVPPFERVLKASKRIVNEFKDVSLFLAGSKIKTCDERITAISDSEGNGKASLNLLARLAKEGKIDGFFSIGDTREICRSAARMGRLNSLGNGSYPALVASFPSINNKTFLVADVGASAEQSLRNSYHQGIMTASYAISFQGIARPRLGLLTNGAEEHKGNNFVKSLDLLFKEQMEKGLGNLIEYAGKVEPDEGYNGDVDILLADGHTGNIALKSVEGTLKFFYKLAKKEIASLPWYERVLLIPALPAMLILKKRVMQRVDPRKYNGAVALGFRGVVLKGHGISDEEAVYWGIRRTIDYVEKGVNPAIEKALEKYSLPRN